MYCIWLNVLQLYKIYLKYSGSTEKCSVYHQENESSNLVNVTAINGYESKIAKLASGLHLYLFI